MSYNTPGDCKEDGNGNKYVFDEFRGTKVFVFKNNEDKSHGVSLSEWESWKLIRSASQVRLFE